MDLFLDLELDGLGGVHVQRVVLESLERPRFIKSATQANQKWLAGTANAAGPTGAWLENLQRSTKPIVAAALAQKPTMIANFNRAINDGKYDAGLAAAGGDAGIKQAAAQKVENYGTATAQGSVGSAKQLATITKIIAYEAQNLPQIYAMGKGTLAQGKARMNAWADIMAAGAGSFG